MIDYTESFDAGLPKGFALADCRKTGTTGIPTATYNAGLGAVDLAYPTANSHQQWRFQNPQEDSYVFNGVVDFDVAVDMEILSGGTGENHCGFHIRSGNGEECWQMGHYKITATQAIQEGVWYGKADGGWNSGMESTGFTQATVTPLVVGTRYILRVVRLAGNPVISFYVNDVLAFTYNNILATTPLWPDFFFYNTLVRVHSVVFKGTVSTAVSALPMYSHTSDSFDTNTYSGTLWGYNGANPSVTWNQSLGSMDVVNTSQDSKGWLLTGLNPTLGSDYISFEADLELFADPSGRKHCGFWLYQAGSNLMTGYRIHHLDASWGISKWNSSAETAVSGLATSYGNNPTFNSGERHRVRIDKKSSVMSLYVDDRLVLVASDASFSGLVPGIFLYGCSVRVHSYWVRELNALPRAADASFAGLDALILAKSPYLYYDVTASANQSIANKGSAPLPASWVGGLPQFVDAGYCSFARLDSVLYALINGTDTIDLTAGFTMEALIQLDTWRAYSRVLEIGSFTSSSVFQLLGFDLGASSGQIRGGECINGGMPTLTSSFTKFGEVIHLVLTVSPDKVIRLFLNGLQMASYTLSTVISSLVINAGNMFYSLWPIKGVSASDQTLMGWCKYIAMYRRPLTSQEILDHIAQITVLGVKGSDFLLPKAKTVTLQAGIRANPELLSVAWPGENNYPAVTQQKAGRVLYAKEAIPLARPYLRSELGYIAGIVTRKGTPAKGQRVLCMDYRFNVMDETISGADGSYRFDSLPINSKYIVIAKDNDDYKYNPAAIDMKTPEAYL